MVRAMSCNPQRQANSELQTPNPELQTPNSELQTPNSQTPNPKLRTPNSKLRTPNSEPRTPNPELHIPANGERDSPANCDQKFTMSSRTFRRRLSLLISRFRCWHGGGRVIAKLTANETSHRSRRNLCLSKRGLSRFAPSCPAHLRSVR